MFGRFIGLICCRGGSVADETHSVSKTQNKKLKKHSSPVDGQDYSETDQKLKQTEESEAESSKVGSAQGVLRKKKLTSAHSNGSNASASLQSEDLAKQQPDSFETFRQVISVIYRQRRQHQHSQQYSSGVFNSKRVSDAIGIYSSSFQQQEWNVLDVLFNFGENEDEREPSDLAQLLVSRLGYCEQLLSVSDQFVELFAEINLSSIRGYTGRAKGGVLAEGINM